MTIREARQAAKLTQAEAAKFFGVSKRAVEEWEAGNKTPREGVESICEKLGIIGMLTQDAREGLLNGEGTFDELAPTYKLQQVKKLTGWGRYPDTFSAIIDNIPDSVLRRLPAQELAELVDAMQAVYQQGVGYGRGTKPEYDNDKEEKNMRKIWFAVVTEDDNDWGYGSYDFAEARRKALEIDDCYIAVIDVDESGAECVYEIPREDLEEESYDHTASQYIKGIIDPDPGFKF